MTWKIALSGKLERWLHKWGSGISVGESALMDQTKVKRLMP
jgi:hypothetical protein